MSSRPARKRRRRGIETAIALEGESALDWRRMLRDERATLDELAKIGRDRRHVLSFVRHPAVAPPVDVYDAIPYFHAVGDPHDRTSTRAAASCPQNDTRGEREP